MRTAIPALGLVLVLALGTGACSDDDAAPDDRAGGMTEAATEPDEDGTTTDTADADDPGDADGSDDGSTVSIGAEAFEPVSVEVDKEFVDKGVEVTLEGVDVQPDGLFFRISAFNNSDRTAELAIDPELVYATDERGDRLRFQPPSDNPTLAFDPGETREARLAFAARFREPPRVVAVWFNYSDDTTPAEPRDDVTVVSATFNNVFVRGSDS